MLLKRTHRAVGMATIAFSMALAVASSAASAEVPRFPAGSVLNRAAGELNEEGMVSSLIVKPRTGAGASIASALRAFDASSLSKSANVPLTVWRRMSGEAHVIKLKQPVTLSEARVIAARLMHNDQSLEYAEPDRMVHTLTTTPTDPGYGNQWHYFAPPSANKGGANLPLAWDANKGNPSVVVAVIDNGYRQHIDFAPVLPGFDFITDPTAAHDGDGRDTIALDPSDAVIAGECGVGTPAKNSHWHGTWVIGIVAALMNNGQGGTGVAPNGSILPVRVVGKCGGLTSDVVDGMRWAAGLSVAGVPANPNPAKVLNISIGAPGACGPTFQAAVTEIVNAGSVIVVATGNGSLTNGVEAPANCSGVIAVTGHAIDGDLAWYSNVDPQVAISAPGGGCGKLTFGSTCSDISSSNGLGVYSTFNSGVTSPGADSYLTNVGTSASAPHVAGVAALMFSVQPTLTPAQIRSYLQTSVRPFPAGSWCTTSGIGLCGTGLLDAYAALRAIPASPPTVTLTNPPTSPSQIVAPYTTVLLSGAASSASGRSISAYAWTQLTGASVGTIANNNTANASFTAPATGTYSFQLTATDSGALTGTATATVRVNSPPVLTPVAAQTVFAGNTLNFTVSATDADGDTPIFVSVSLPPGATLSATGAFSWPAATPVGNYTLTYMARDNDANSAQGTVNISVVTGGGGVDMLPPTSPSSLTASPISGGQITLSWPAATDDVGVTGYQVERCQGVGCTTFALLGTTTATNYVDAGLSPGTSYRYRIRAQDAVGNFSPYSPITTTGAGAIAISFDAVSNSANNNTSRSVAWSHTTGTGSNRALLVCAQARGATQNDVTVSTLTYGGSGLTVLRSDVRNAGGGIFFGTALYYKVAPASGTGTVQITWVGTPTGYGVGTATSYAGVHPTTPIEAVSGSNGTGGMLVTNITSVTDNSWIADCAIGRGDNGAPMNIGGGQTVRTNRLTTAPAAADVLGVSTVNGKTPAGNETMDWTQNGSSDWVMSAVSLRPAGAVAPPTATISFDAVSNSANNNTSQSVAWSHTTGIGSNRALLVCTQARSTAQASVSVSSVTYSGAALTFVRGDTRSDGAGTYFRTEQWVQATPASGANNVAITWAGTPTGGYAVGTATTYAGVNGTPVDAGAGNSGKGAALATNITTATTDDWVVDCAIGRGDNGLTATVGGNQTVRTNRLTGSPTPADIVAVSTVNGKTPAGNETMDWTQNVASDWVMSAVALKPAAVSTTGITFDAVGVSANSNTTNTISWAHTVGAGSNRLFAVCAQARDFNHPGFSGVSSITFGGVGLTKVRADKSTDPTFQTIQSELWYLVAPTVGTGTVMVTWGGAPLDWGVGASTSYFGVDQANPVDAHNGSTAVGTALATTVTTVNANAWITDCAIGRGDGTVPFTVVGPTGLAQTPRSNRITGTVVDAVGVSTVNGKASPGAEVMDWTQSVAQEWTISAVSLKPAP